ncbi:MAG: TIGR03118 family protein, partial [Edaphobacter sp.]
KFASAHLAGSFADPTIPKGFAPFGIHSIAGKVYVTYAQANPISGREVVGAGLGYVDLFYGDGNFIQRAISQSSLNAPWGMALAPAGFGSYGGDLLVGNFGDGIINVYDPVSFALKGQLQDASGSPIANTGLWEIVFGTNGVGDPNILYFAAGINGEKDGLFGSIAVAPPASGTPDFSVQTTTKAVSVAAGQAGSLTLSLAATNGFTGPVSLSCSGLPTGDTCTFLPSSISLSGSTSTSVMVSIGTAPAVTPPATGPYIANKVSHLWHSHEGMTLAFLGPFGILTLFGIKRKSAMLRGSVLVIVFALFTLTATGCSSSQSQQQPTSNPMPAAPQTSQVMVTATSGAITHSITVALTVQ